MCCRELDPLAHREGWLKAQVFKILFLPELVAWLNPGHQLPVAVACVQLLGQGADPNTARGTDQSS